MENSDQYEKIKSEIVAAGVSEEQAKNTIESAINGASIFDLRQIKTLLLQTILISISAGVLVGIIGMVVIKLEFLAVIGLMLIFGAVITGYVFLCGIASLSKNESLTSILLKYSIVLILGFLMLASSIILISVKVYFGGFCAAAFSLIIIMSAALRLDKLRRIYRMLKNMNNLSS